MENDEGEAINRKIPERKKKRTKILIKLLLQATRQRQRQRQRQRRRELQYSLPAKAGKTAKRFHENHDMTEYVTKLTTRKATTAMTIGNANERD